MSGGNLTALALRLMPTPMALAISKSFTASLMPFTKLAKVSLLVLLAMCWLAETASAQPLTKSKLEDMLRVAEEELADNRPYSALEWFGKAYEENKDPALAFRIGMLNYELRDYQKAVSYLQRSLRKSSTDDRSEGHFYLGCSQKMQGFYGEAMESFREFKRESPQHPLVPLADIEIAGAQMALRMVDPPRIKVDNAGREVNTSNQEYSPVLASDGNLYYAGFGKSGFVSEEGDDAAYIRIYLAKSQQSGDYAKGTALPKTINRDGYHTVNLAISKDGNSMLLIRTLLDGTTLTESKLYFASKSGDNWGQVTEVKNVNGNYLVKNPAFGELFGKEVVFFASDMPGGKGGYDLYYATKSGDGLYGSPLNLGDQINTPYDEETPFYNDGTLYFSTIGRPTLGGFDVYRSDWGGDTWSEPVNMGKGFNSSYDDRYFQLDKTGKNGVLTSNRPPTRSVKSKTCCDDVFLLNVEPIIINLLATTLDGDGGLLPGVTMDLIEIADGDSTVLSRKLNPKGNRFDFELVDDKSYVLIATLEGYETASAELNTLGITEPTKIERTLVLTRAKDREEFEPGEETIELTLNQPIRLANIYYDFDDDKILPASEPDLLYIKNIMTDYPEMVVELGSHTDAQGRDAYNQELSQRRAQSAVNWLVGRGIDRARLRAKGYGETVILNRCTNGVQCPDDEHRFNRRTEFKILEGPTSIQVKKQTRTIQTPPKRVNRSGKQSMADSATAQPDAQKLVEVKSDTTPAPKLYNDRISTDMSSLYYEKELSGLPILEFDDRQIEFGMVKRGDMREHRYLFVNRGTAAATIALVSACECTTLDWTRGPIQPGEKGFVNAIFDSSDKSAGELISIDIILDQQAASGNGIIERVEYTFEIEK